MDGDEDSGCDEDVFLRRGGQLRTRVNVDRDRKATRLHSGDELLKISEELNHKEPEKYQETNTDKGRGQLRENNNFYPFSRTFVRFHFLFM